MAAQGLPFPNVEHDALPYRNPGLASSIHAFICFVGWSLMAIVLTSGSAMGRSFED